MRFGSVGVSFRATLTPISFFIYDDSFAWCGVVDCGVVGWVGVCGGGCGGGRGWGDAGGGESAAEQLVSMGAQVCAKLRNTV